MKAIMVMFDSLNRRFLPNYDCDWVHAPNFERLAARTVTFDNSYGGSMPCMPARREMHTGRYNFLHRSWSPLEPFDDSIPQMLSQNGVYTHLATDHQHYFEDGGATYHHRFNSFEFFRGQQGDKWKGHVADPDIPESHRLTRYPAWRQDWVNRTYMTTEAEHPQTKLFDAGLEFLQTNVDQDQWFLQLECFDPHEPFFSYEDYRQHYDSGYEGPHFDWPDYKKADESKEMVDHARNEYAALLSMCDASLGRVMDFMDTHHMWDDTMLIVCTDHGFLLGEHGWWGKNIQPWYDENIHTPLFVWDPRTGVRGERRNSLVQTVDIGPTLLDFFALDGTPSMHGQSLRPVVENDTPLRTAALFGSFGGHVNVTDARYVYMRACKAPDNQPLFEHTLMPTHMYSRFTPEELVDAELIPPLPFTKGAPVLRIPATAWGNPYNFGTLLFDLAEDPEQKNPLRDETLEFIMAEHLVRLMRENDAPLSQFQRLGLPSQGPIQREHLLVGEQWNQVLNSMEALPVPVDFGDDGQGVNATLAELMTHEPSRAVLEKSLGQGALKPLLRMSSMTLLSIAAAAPILTTQMLRDIHTELLDVTVS